MQQNYFYKTVFFMIFFMMPFVMPGFSGAWFAESKVQDMPLPVDTLQPDSDLKEFVIYDSMTEYDKNDKTIKFLPGSSYFVPADKIDIYIPLKILAKRSVSTMESLDRLLLANIRIRLLLQEYKKMQQRADKLLQNVNIPYLDKDFIQNSNKKQKSLNQQKKKMDKKLADVIISSHFASNRGSLKSFSPILELKPLLNSSNTDNKPGEKRQNYYQTALNVNNGSHGMGKNIVPIGDGTSSELPWIFRFFLNMVSYVVSNKLETLLFGSVMFLLIYFISLQAKS